MRVLLPISRASYGVEPYFYLIEYLRDQFDFVISTPDETLAAQCHGRGISVLPYPTPGPTLPAWMRRLQRRKIFWPMTNSLEEYRQQRHLASQARLAIDHARPDVILLAGDYSNMEYYLCGRGIPTVVTQVTAGWASVEEILDHFPPPNRKRGLAIGLLRALSLVMRRPLVYKIAGQRRLPHGLDIGRTVGGALGGLRYTINQKGANADVICLNGPAPGEILARAGATHARQVVTGSPLDDKLFRAAQDFSAEDERSLRGQLNIPAAGCIIAFFLQNFHDLMLGGNDYIAEVTRIAHELVAIDERVFLVTKPHPRHDKSLYRINHPRVIITDAPGEDFNNRLILSSRLVITRNSTVGYNAMGFGVPLLTYSLYDLPIEKHFVYTGGSVDVTSYEAIVSQSRRLLFDEDARASLHQEQVAVRGRYMLLDGRCRERIGAVLRAEAKG